MKDVGEGFHRLTTSHDVSGVTYFLEGQQRVRHHGLLLGVDVLRVSGSQSLDLLEREDTTFRSSQEAKRKKNENEKSTLSHVFHVADSDEGNRALDPRLFRNKDGSARIDSVGLLPSKEEKREKREKPFRNGSRWRRKKERCQTCFASSRFCSC